MSTEYPAIVLGDSESLTKSPKYADLISLSSISPTFTFLILSISVNNSITELSVTSARELVKALKTVLEYLLVPKFDLA